jgi:hypothetical protein
MEDFEAYLKRFADAVADPKWTEESDHIVHDYHAAVYSSKTFVEKETRIEKRVIVSELEWKGHGKSVDDVSRDFWELYGRFGESEQFVSRVVEQNAITFYIISGNTDDPVHGHLCLIRVTGHRVITIVQTYFQIREEITRAIRKSQS